MGHIYKVTNKVNGKVYIGQTMREIFIRWKEHVRYSSYDDLDYKSLLYYAIRKYGADSFSIEEIEECEDSKLDEREQYWIDFYHSCEDGYNINIGGQGTQKYKTEPIMNLWTQGYTAKRIAEELGISRQVVTKRLKGNGVQLREILSRGNKAVAKKRKVLRISKDGMETVLYNTMAEAAEANNLRTSALTMVCSGERNFAHGYRWQYYDGEDLPLFFEPFPVKDHCPKQVHQYTMDGKYMRTFRTMSEAARSLGKSGVRTIKYACGGLSRSGYGYKWSLNKYDVLPNCL